ncbi:hypothetical protein QUH73_20820, partial [Labilibaculum sp. K2S]|uniref:hypothetical protein n=1 Tax=Labilibaculum sp. K2S TaxID=3056386 RepID=UPI0025A4741D
TIGASKVTNAKLDKSNIPLSGFGNAATDVSIGDGTTNYKITNVLDPTDDQDVATKYYVNNYAFAQPMSETQMLGLSSPGEGRLAFCTDCGSGSLMLYYNGSWISVGTANASPYATSVGQTGTILKATETLTGEYVYNDVDGDPQAVSTFKWYRADDNTGTGEAVITGATSSTYTIQVADVSKFLRFGVTPVAGGGVGQGIHVKAS